MRLRALAACATFATRTSALKAPTAAAALRDAVARLRDAAVPEPEASAEWLLAHALGGTDRGVAARAVAAREPLSEAQRSTFDAHIERRRNREPVQYIVGAWGFHDVEVLVEAPLLVPRPETEELVDLVAAWWGSDGPARFADAGCGTGCLGLALLNALPAGSSCVAVDVSPKAVAVSTANAARLGLDGAYAVSETPAAALEGAFDFIVSNPPYIPSADLVDLDAEVGEWEDPGALDGGPDGLAVARDVLDRASAVLVGSRRSVWLELDPTGPGLLRAEGFSCRSFDDAAGRVRFARVDL